jgi:hypothetical protein
MPIGQGYAGLAKETSFGTKATVNEFIPVKSLEATQDPQNYYPEEIRNSRGRAKGIPMGLQNEGSVEMDAEPQSLGHILLAAMGNVATNQPNAAEAPTVYSHLFTPGNTLPSYTWEKYDTVMVQSLVGCKTDTLTLAVEAGGDGTLTAEMDLRVKSVQEQETASAPAYNDKDPFVFHKVTVTKGGAVNDNLKSMEIEISNNLKDDQFYLKNSREVGAIDEGMREVSFSGEMKFKNKAEYTAFANGKKDNFVIKFEGASIGGTFKDTLEINLGKVLYDSFEVPMGGPDDEVLASFEGAALIDPATGHEIEITLTNTVVSY